MGEVLFAGEEAQAQKTQKRRALLGVWSPVVLKRNAHHGITGHIFLLTTRVQHRALRDRTWFSDNDFERHLAADVCHGSEVGGEDDADHHCYPFPSGSRALGNFSHAFSVTPFLFQV